jgi:hypothetical protein
VVAPGTARRVFEVVAVLVLLTGLLAGDGVAAEDPTEGFFVAPSLQISPELPDVRPGVPVELTARLSHPVLTDTAVHFHLRALSGRVMYRRPAPPLEQPECTVPARELTCAITLVRHVPTALIVRGWLGGQPEGPDTREGRLSSLNLFFHPGADCRLEDGEPLDDKCRGGLNSQVERGRPEPDNTDVVLVGWSGTAAAFVDCDDPGTDGDTEIERRPADQRTVTFTCTLTNRVTGDPVVGGHLAGKVTGGPFDHDPNGQFHSDYGPYPYHPEERRLCTTTAPGGHCTFDLTVPGNGAGDMPVCFWSDGDTDAYYGGEDENDGGGCPSEPFDEEPDDGDGSDSVIIRLE